MIIFDIETDGLDANLIHVLSWTEDNGKTVQSTNDYDEMRELLCRADTLCGHNIIGFDIPVVERLLGIKVKAKLIDTLGLSWYLEPNRMQSHGLDAWGSSLGIKKPKIDDWENLSYEDYKHRCEEDVKINAKLWHRLSDKLKQLYSTDTEAITNYISFKLQCAADQAALGWRLDVDAAEELHARLVEEKEKKEFTLSKTMPKRPITKVMNPPKVLYNKNGAVSKKGEAWFALLRKHRLPQTTTQPVTVLEGYEDGNPNSVPQIKEWLHSLGWNPKTYKFVRDKVTGEERKIEQVRDGSELCESVKALADVDPAVELLDGLTVLTHRIGIVAGFLECHKDGWLKAEIAGLTNTLRFKHRKPLVNLPGVDKPLGAEIRGLLLAPAGEALCGCDMVSLEDTTKRHYMQPIDPAYVEQMEQPGFDPHLDLALHAGAVTAEQIADHNAGKINLTPLRKNFKAANYACTYGVGATTLSRQTGLPKKEASKLITAYWQRNHAVQKIADDQKIKLVGRETWMLNPVSGFWHNLRSDKDRFSTLNQSTGVYVFDNFVALIKNRGVRVIGQFHDEVIIPTDDATATAEALKSAATALNQKLKFNVELKIDYSFGNTYADVH